MDKTRVVTLIRQFEAGQLSRNKNPEHHEEFAVRDARRRQIRLAHLGGILLASRDESWEIRLAGTGPHGAYMLSCRCPRLKFQWYAHLDDFEIALLREGAEVRRILDASLADDPEIVFASAAR